MKPHGHFSSPFPPYSPFSKTFHPCSFTFTKLHVRIFPNPVVNPLYIIRISRKYFCVEVRMFKVKDSAMSDSFRAMGIQRFKTKGRGQEETLCKEVP